MRTRGLGLLAALAITGCKDTPPPGCRLAESVPLPPGPLTLTKNATIQRAGAGFVLVGSEGDEVRWAPLGLDGTLGPESKLTLPQRLLRPEPWFATTTKSATGDQLIVAYVAPKAGATSQLQIAAISQSPGGPPSAPSVLADLPAGVDPAIVRLAMGPSHNGQHAALAWGFEGQDASPSLLLLKADAQPMGAPILLRQGPGARWSCLDVIASRSDFGVSIQEPGGGSGVVTTWRTFEMRDDGVRSTDVGIGIDVVPTGCITAAPTDRGYVIAYQNADGTYFSDYDIPKGNVNEHIVVGALQFGGVARQPKVACVSAMGLEVSLLFARDSGPEVRRFDSFGAPQGRPLVLPSAANQVGPVSALPGRDSFWATYLDQRSGMAASGVTDGNIAGNTRYLVRVDCPQATPPVPADAAIADGGK
jgi:hypothetical protein